ncbi:MAG: SET domain-containing protein [Gammaproteobacteria bacterium]|jgi:SET domain-containing protein
MVNCLMPKLPEITYVSESKIHGKGLFAQQTIKKGTLLGYLEGQPTTIDGSYVLWLNDKEGFEVSCNLKFINHSDHPNACYYDDLSVVAIRAIKIGDEITHNYESSEW